MAWAPNYVSATDLKSYLRIDDAVDDAVLSLAIAAASRAIDLYCNRQFGRVDAPEDRTYTAEWDRRRSRWVINFDDLMSVSGFAVQAESGAIDVYTFKPVNAAVQGRPWTSLIVDPDSTYKPNGEEDEITITAVWGWTSVPEAVEQATMLQASRLFSRRNAPFGVAGSPDLGSEMRLLAKVDPDVAVSLSPYVRWWAGA